MCQNEVESFFGSHYYFFTKVEMQKSKKRHENFLRQKSTSVKIKPHCVWTRHAQKQTNLSESQKRASPRLELEKKTNSQNVRRRPGDLNFRFPCRTKPFVESRP